MKENIKSRFTKQWIIEKGVPITESYDGNVTIRELYYQLVAIGMTNDMSHYKKVVNAMIWARWNGLLRFDAFVDHERETIGYTAYRGTDVETESEIAKEQIKVWATSYHKNRWDNQPYYPEVFIEKKALQGVFEETCDNWDIALNPCKGYPSLTFLNSAKVRFELAAHEGKQPIILYFGDYDCSGEDIPRSICDNLEKIGITLEVKRILLLENQVRKWKLPPAPTKTTDTRSRTWNGIGQVELEAVERGKKIRILNKAIGDIFDNDLYDELKETEEQERKEFKAILERDFKSLLD